MVIKTRPNDDTIYSLIVRKNFLLRSFLCRFFFAVSIFFFNFVLSINSFSTGRQHYKLLENAFSITKRASKVATVNGFDPDGDGWYHIIIDVYTYVGQQFRLAFCFEIYVNMYYFS